MDPSLPLHAVLPPTAPRQQVPSSRNRHVARPLVSRPPSLAADADNAKQAGCKQAGQLELLITVPWIAPRQLHLMPIQPSQESVQPQHCRPPNNHLSLAHKGVMNCP
jgi:hypothetical protein